MFAFVGRQTNLDEKARNTCRNKGDEVALQSSTLILLDIYIYKRTKGGDSYFRFFRVTTSSVGKSRKSLETMAANRERENQEKHRV